MGPGNLTRRNSSEAGGRGFIALGSGGTTKIIDGEWRVDFPVESDGKNEPDFNTTKQASIPALQQAKLQMAPFSQTGLKTKL